MGYFWTVIGLICFVEGLPYFAFPHHLKKLLAQFVTMPDRPLRIMGGILMLLGLLCVYWGRRHGG